MVLLHRTLSETTVFATGLFFLTPVLAPPIGFCTHQVIVELQLDEPFAIVQFDAVSVPDGPLENVAVQFLAEDIVTLPSEQSASPDQPLNTEPPAGVAVSATTVL